MPESKLIINFQQGLLEVEGSESLVKEIYADFKEVLKTAPPSIPLSFSATAHVDEPVPSLLNKNNESEKKKNGKKAGVKKSSNTSGTFMKDLDLKGNASLISLRNFYSQYIAKSNLERNLIFVYYLQNEMKLININIDHIFTCYREIQNLKIPGNLKQSIFDTTGRKGWLETSDMENISVPINGINYIEHDLEKKSSSDT